MKIVRTIAELREALQGAGDVGLVPTMGAFHDGHLSLMRAARAENDAVVVSLFVNPAQFGEGADLAGYPREEERDARVAEEEGVDFLFAPAPEEIYPPGFSTWIEVEGLSDVLEGAFRPGHFRGVTTICLKLFNIVGPRHAYFGQKDAQQAALIAQLVRDLNVPLELRVLPTVRDADGLALSSRNAGLAPDERERALAIPRALEAGAAAHREGADPVAATRAVLNGIAPDYVEVVRLNGRLVLATAARVGSTRLIDNVVLDLEGASE